MNNLLVAGTAALCRMPGPVMAQDSELDALNRITFEAVDANIDGLVSMREVEHYRELVMISMDDNNDGYVTRKEYMEWDLDCQIDDCFAPGRGPMSASPTTF